MPKNAVWLVAAVVVLGAIVAWAAFRSAGPEPPHTPTPPTPSPTQPRVADSGKDPINISIASSLTKKEWLDESAQAFNSASRSDSNLQVNKKPIAVEVLKEEQPLEPGKFDHWRSGTIVEDTLRGKIKPTIVSPATESWVLKLNKEWRTLHGKEISSGKAPGLVRTPVIIAMWESRARALGCWPVAGPECTWQRIRALAASPDGWGMFGHPEWGKFKFGYSYVGEADVATHTAALLCMTGMQKTSGLTVGDVGTANGCGQAMADVEKAKVHSGKSSPWLLGKMQTGGPEYLDAVTTYEKEVIAFNRANRDKLREPLVAAYPQDGIVVAEHPFTILDGAPWVTAEQVEAAQVFQKFLFSVERQRALVDSGLRPADSSARLGLPIDPTNGANPEANLVTLSVPDILVLDRIVEVWHKVKKHANIVLVFDKSGSMQGEKITEAVKGAVEFVGAMDGEDWLAWLPFDDKLYPGTEGLKSEVGEQLQNNIRSTTANGGTSLYDSISRAYQILEDRRKVQGDTVRYGLVVLSDGKDTNSKEYTLTLLEAMLQPSERDPSGIQIHTIGIGDAEDAVLTKVANSAHGKYWKVKTAPVVVDVYREIARYY